jgi:hypothetical protein
MPAELDGAAELEHNVIVRPHGAGVAFIQLDDLTAQALERVQEAAFLGLQTSLRNFQAWAAMPAEEADEDFVRRLRKAVGADPTASGATRIAGSLNFKNKYAPNFPRVQITHSAHGMIAHKEKLARLGLVAQTDQGARIRPVRVSLDHAAVNRWPSYSRCLACAPPTHDNTRPDVSRADFTWCMIAIDWGRSIAETSARLMQESSKARENGERYALLTARRAAAAVDRRPNRH